MRRPSAATRSLAAAVVALGLAAGPAPGQEGLSVVAVRPARHALAAATETGIRVEFDRPVLPSSVTPASFRAFGQWSGPAGGEFRFGRTGRAVTLVPERRFSAGERVKVFLSHDLRGTDGTSLRRAGYSFQFWTRSRGSGFRLDEIDRFSTRTSPSGPTRAYGGLGSDLDGDGFLDLTIVNEDTDDLRVFLNRGDRSGRFTGLLRPPARVGDTPSPSEPSDFDGDGQVDVVVANTQGSTVSILLGHGDGTFAPAREVEVGGEPRGVAVLDADGDGDVDIAATSFAAGTVTVRFNDGQGGFDEASVFGRDGAWAMAAGDMNDDGVLDLVVGTRGPDEVHTYLGHGDGTFSLIESRESGGSTWMLVVGDVDGNGTEDVAVVNGPSDNAAILAGAGDGGLGAPQILQPDPFPLATDLADLDGDGDLDWVTSSFFGGWTVFENDGRGSFSPERTISASQAASCSLAMDLDNDGALDLALIDELEDEVILMKSTALVFASDFESGDTDDWSRTRGAVAVVQPGLRESGHALEVTADGSSARSFVASRHPDREASLVVGFELDPRRVELAGGEIEILRLVGAGEARAVLTLEDAGSRLRVRLRAGDEGGLRDVGSTGIRASGPVRLRVEWAGASGRSAADGRAALRKGRRIRALAVDLRNHGELIDEVRLGLPAGSEGTAGGSLLIDEYASTR